MNNYTTARAPLRLSELSSILEQRINQPAPEAPPVKAEKPPKAKKAKATSGMAHSQRMLPAAPAIKVTKGKKPKT
jgi:hypothetical protein